MNVGTHANKRAITSNVSLTESKLIIALKKQLLEAKSLLEREHTFKLKLIEGARDLKRRLMDALQRERHIEKEIANTLGRAEMGAEEVMLGKEAGN